MEQAKILLFNFIIIPQIILASYTNIASNAIKTGDASAKSSSQIITDEENVVVENNEVNAYSNTGGNSSSNESNSVTTGDSSAVSEIKINNGKVEGKLEVEANGERKELKVKEPGDYKLELNKEGNVVATSQSKMKEKSAEPNMTSYWQKFLNFIFSFFKQ